MAVFKYEAVDIDASVVAGTVIADSPRGARDSLRERGLTITQVVTIDEAASGTMMRRRRGRSAGEVIAFVREMGTLLAAGIPLLTALGTLERQHSRQFKTVIQKLSDQVAAGSGLGEAMSHAPEYFDELCVNIVKVGENTGSLETALKRLADFKEKAHRLRSQVTTALMYPMVVCLIGLAVSIFLMTYVVPNLMATLEQAGNELPALTRGVKAMSDFLLAYWWALLMGIGAAVIGANLLLRGERVRHLADGLVLKLPLLGDLIRKENVSRLAVVMAALLRSGLEFIEAIQITRRTLTNRVFRDALDEYETAVAAGRDVSAPLEESGVFGPMVVQMLAVGQQAGQLEDMLEQLAAAYDQEVATASARLTALLEPFLIVVLAVLVGTVALAMILPILEVSNVL